MINGNNVELSRTCKLIPNVHLAYHPAEKSSINQHGFQAGPCWNSAGLGWFKLVSSGIVLLQTGLCWYSASLAGGQHIHAVLKQNGAGDAGSPAWAL